MTDRAAGWARLHPLSPLLRFSRAVFVLLVAVAPRTLAGDTGGARHSWPELAVLILAVAAGVVSWVVTRWRVAGSELQIETGFLRRQSIRVPLARVQAVDIVRPLLGRALGLAELRVVVAGSGAGRSRLAYLRDEQAEAVRARLLALAHGLHEETPEPPERPISSVGNGRLVVASLLGTPTVALLGLVAFAGAAAALSGRPAVAVSVLPAIFVVGSAVLTRVNLEFGLSVAEAPDGLRVRGGLLQTRAETIPYGRVQALRWVEPLLWRPLRWCRLEVDVARQRRERGDDSGSNASERALLPVGSPGEVRSLLERVFPGVDPLAPLARRPPARARAKAPLSFRNLGVWYDDRYVVTGGGRVSRTMVVVPLEKVQSLRLVQGPLARRLHLATVHVDLVGRRWRAAARCRDAVEAADLLDRLTELARRARGRSAGPADRRTGGSVGDAG